MKTSDIPTTSPTPDQVKAARLVAELTQREASLYIFGPHSDRRFQQWELGLRQAPQGQFILFLLMTDQITPKQAQEVLLTKLEKG